MASTAEMRDIYIRKLSATWQEMQFASYWGGSFDDGLVALLIDSAGRLNLVATTNSLDYPVTLDALQTAVVGIGVGLTRFSLSADNADFSTTWGGLLIDRISLSRFRAHIVPGDRIIWCGSTLPRDLPNLAEPLPGPLVNSFTNALIGGYDPTSGGWLPSYLFGGRGTTFARDCTVTTENKLVVAGSTDSAAFPLVGSSLPSSGMGMRAFVSLIHRQ